MCSKIWTKTILNRILQSTSFIAIAINDVDLMQMVSRSEELKLNISRTELLLSPVTSPADFPKLIFPHSELTGEFLKRFGLELGLAQNTARLAQSGR